MPTDFAARGTRSGKKKAKPRRKTTSRRANPKARVLFHAPSFSAGAIAGAAIVLLVAYAPDLIKLGGSDETSGSRQTEQETELVFEFPERLASSEVRADPEVYAPPEVDDRPLNIQAASFRDAEDADELRASLLLKNIPATVDRSVVSGATWYRVRVGPFERKVEADRAMTRLREMYLTPIWLNN